MHLCLYTQSHEPSGMGQHMADLAAEFVGSFDVSLVCRDTAGSQRLLQQGRQLGIETLALPSPHDPRFVGLVQDWVRSRHVDVFHCHTGLGFEVALGQRAARDAGVPVAVRTQHLPFVAHSLRRRARYMATVPLVDRVIAVSDGVRRTYEKLGVPPSMITTITNGIRPHRSTLTREQARERLGVDASQRLLLTVGRLTHMKGQRYLLEAMQQLAPQHPGVVLAVIGSGPLAEELPAQAHRLGLGRTVRFLGHRSDVRDVLVAADLFVLPSLQEGHPLVVLEAMAAGVPVVGTRISGTQEIIEDGVTGRLAPPADAAGLARVLAEVLARPDDAARQAATAAGQFARLYSSARMAAETAEVYRGLLQGSARASVATA